MPISPAQFEGYAEEIRRAYEEAERVMVEKVAKRLERGIESPGWAERKLAEVRQMRLELEGEVDKLAKLTPAIEQAIQRAYDAGMAGADLELASIPIKRRVSGGVLDMVMAGGAASHTTAIEALVKKAVGSIESTYFRILRVAEDAYRNTIYEASQQVLTGAVTRREATQAALRRFANQGISGFVDVRGRHWDMATYAEMATRSTTGQAAVQGHVSRLAERGHDLVIVSDHMGECDACRPWEGKVLSISGRTSGYPRLNDAVTAGLMHPNCRHTVGLYVQGLTRPMKNTEDPEGYAIAQEQRRLERNIRLWRRRETAAITDIEKRQATAKVREWQARNRAFVEKHGLRRKYDREQIWPRVPRQPAATFTPAKTLREAEEYVRKYLARNVNFSAPISVDDANAICRALTEVRQGAGLRPLEFLEITSDPAWINNGFYRPVERHIGIGMMATNEEWIQVLRGRLAEVKRYASDMALPQHIRADCLEVVKSLRAEIRARTEGRFDQYVLHSSGAFGNLYEGCVRHEAGHMFCTEKVDLIAKFFGTAPSIRPPTAQELMRETLLAEKYGLTRRARDSWHECIAENFTLYSIGRTERMHPDMIRFFKEVIRWSTT